MANPETQRYCIDTSALIAAFVERYPPDVFPSLWPKIDALISTGVLLAPEEVRQELTAPPELKQWADDRDELFREIEEPDHQAMITQVVDRIMAEITSRGMRLRPQDFKADPFVVTLGRIEAAVVVCEEQSQRDRNGRPKMPNVCSWWGVSCVDLVGLFRAVGITI